MIERLATVRKARIGRRIGQTDNVTLTHIGRALAVFLGAGLSRAGARTFHQLKKLTFRQYQVLANLPEIQPTVMEQVSDRQFWHHSSVLHHSYDNAGLRSCFCLTGPSEKPASSLGETGSPPARRSIVCRAGGHCGLALRHPITRAVRPLPARGRAFGCVARRIAQTVRRRRTLWPWPFAPCRENSLQASFGNARVLWLKRLPHAAKSRPIVRQASPHNGFETSRCRAARSPRHR